MVFQSSKGHNTPIRDYDKQLFLIGQRKHSLNYKLNINVRRYMYETTVAVLEIQDKNCIMDVMENNRLKRQHIFRCLNSFINKDCWKTAHTWYTGNSIETGVSLRSRHSLRSGRAGRSRRSNYDNGLCRCCCGGSGRGWRN